MEKAESAQRPLLWTRKELCRMCYSCVRECPAKAIRVSGGQAEVIPERCIGCGNCVRVCTQHAKETRSSLDAVRALLDSPSKTAACIAPSFPAEFADTGYRVLVSQIRSLGFDYVIEVAFGADLVSRRYATLMDSVPEKSYIATTCPAVVSYVEKFHPDLTSSLAPIASPMIAAARAVHSIYGNQVKTVFIGPCLAKKNEAERPELAGDISCAMTFQELRQLMNEGGCDRKTFRESEFDPPHAGLGAIYPIGGGLLQAAGIDEDLLSMNVVSAEGNREFIQSLADFEAQEHQVGLLEILCCSGCIMGPGMSSQLSQYSRRALVSSYAKAQHARLDPKEWKRDVESLDSLDLSVSFTPDDRRFKRPPLSELREILASRNGSLQSEDLDCGACGYPTCLDYAAAVYRGLAENEMCLPYMIERLKKTAAELSESYRELVGTKQALIQSEKLASLGRMASGIAHEINNPLTGILSFSSTLLEDMEKSDHGDDIRTIVNETLRCRDIVRGLLNFARETKSSKKMSNLNKIIHEAMPVLMPYVNSLNIELQINLCSNLPDQMLDQVQMRSVINNLVENAAHAMPDGGVISVSTGYDAASEKAQLEVRDTGNGISPEYLDKIFDPFFTTKEVGKGTGLGLAVAYGIVQAHYGTIDVESEVGSGTLFTVTIPVKDVHTGCRSAEKGESYGKNR